MKKIVLSFLLLATSIITYSQNVVHWTYSAKKILDKTYELHLTATIDEGWHIYSQTMVKDDITVPTEINFNKNPLLTLSGKTKEVGKMITKHEEVLDMDLKYYQGKVDFVQVVKLKTNAKTNVNGSIDYMSCTDEKCLPPKTEKFSITIE